MLDILQRKATKYMCCLPSSSTPQVMALLFGLSSLSQLGGGDVMFGLLWLSEHTCRDGGDIRDARMEWAKRRRVDCAV